MQNMYEAFLGVKNRIYYLAKFEQFDKKSPGLKASWNWPAFFCIGIWALYRKMYGWFFAYLGVSLILQISIKNGYPGFGALIFFVSWFSFTILANSFYHNSVKKKIAVAQFTFKDESKLFEFLRYKGGVNTWVFWTSGLLTVSSITAVIVIAIYLPQAKQTIQSQYPKLGAPVVDAPFVSSQSQQAQTNLDVVDPFASNQPATTSQTNRLDNISNAPVAPQSTQQLENLRTQANMDPGKANVWITYGNALMDSQQFGEAIEAYKKVLAIDPKNVDVRVDMGTCNRNVSKPDVAIEEFRKAIKLNPNHLNAHRNLGIVLAFDMKDRAAGIKELEKFLELAPNAPDAAQIKKAIEALKAGN